MFKKMQGLLKNNKGFTLVELLAVIVILGIIAAIAIPSIGGIIDNTKKDAYVANAQQMIGAAKLAAASDPKLIPAVGQIATIQLEYLIEEGYMEAIDDPYEGNIATGSDDEPLVTAKNDIPYSSTYSEVYIQNKAGQITYYVSLIGDKAKITGPQNDLSRDDVH